MIVGYGSVEKVWAFFDKLQDANFYKVQDEKPIHKKT